MNGMDLRAPPRYTSGILRPWQWDAAVRGRETCHFLGQEQSPRARVQFGGETSHLLKLFIKMLLTYPASFKLFMQSVLTVLGMCNKCARRAYYLLRGPDSSVSTKGGGGAEGGSRLRALGDAGGDVHGATGSLLTGQGSFSGVRRRDAEQMGN